MSLEATRTVVRGRPPRSGLICILCDESNKKIKSNKITHGNRFIRIASVQCAWAASRTKDCYFSKFYAFHTQVRKKFKLKVVVAVARKILVCIWHILKFNVSYKDFEPQKSVAKDSTQLA